MPPWLDRETTYTHQAEVPSTPAVEAAKLLVNSCSLSIWAPNSTLLRIGYSTSNPEDDTQIYPLVVLNKDPKLSPTQVGSIKHSRFQDGSLHLIAVIADMKNGFRLMTQCAINPDGKTVSVSVINGAIRPEQLSRYESIQLSGSLQTLADMLSLRDRR